MTESIHLKAHTGEISKVEAQKTRLHKACQEFGSIMTKYMLKSMRESVMKAEESDSSKDVYEGMMDDALANQMSQAGWQGLSDLLYKQLVPLVQSQTSPSAPASPHPDHVNDSEG